MFCGWDWGSTHHGVCVIDDMGTVIEQWLRRHGDWRPVCRHRPRSALGGDLRGSCATATAITSATRAGPQITESALCGWSPRTKT